jgi:hypothetical protein
VKLGFLLGGSHCRLDQAVACPACHLSADLTHRIARILGLFGRLPSEKNTEYSSCSTEIVLGSRMVYVGHVKHNREQVDGLMCNNCLCARAHPGTGTGQKLTLVVVVVVVVICN